eukprot:23600-Pyramimonas_sp.AAC.1
MLLAIEDPIFFEQDIIEPSPFKLPTRHHTTRTIAAASTAAAATAQPTCDRRSDRQRRPRLPIRRSEETAPKDPT